MRLAALVIPIALVGAAPVTRPATQPAATRAAKLRIVLAGDSTVTNNAGWAVGFANALSEDENLLEIINFSRGGRSSKSFIDEGRWKQCLDAKPDYVLIQFGHNDEPGHGAERESDPNTTYRANIARYVDEARAAGIKPVLVTPISRRQWGDDGHIRSSLRPYAEAMKGVATEKQVPLINLWARSIEVYESLGKDGCLMISPIAKDEQAENGEKIDGTHLNEPGSRLFGPIVADELMRVVPELKSIKAKYRPPTIAPASMPANDVALAATKRSDEGPSPRGTKSITVALDGSGDFKTVQEAIDAAPTSNSDRTTIRIKPGTYVGLVVVPMSKPNVTLEGDDLTTTFISYALNVQDPIPSNVPPRMNGNGVIVLGDGFRAKNLTFRNSSGDHGQAMALRLQCDRASIVNCHLLGWQDTLLTYSGRHYFRDCHIEGRVDFIYGAATCFFENCEILSKNGGYVTAASTPEDHPYGYVFSHCKLIGGGESPAPTYLGRPWRPFASVTFVDCEMGDHIRPEGWHNWGKESNEKTARYREYKCTGPGADRSQRAPWTRELSDEEARKYTIENILKGDDNWDPTHD